MDGLENILKLGGYLILFSMLAKLLLLLIGSLPLCSCLTVGLLEITNGIALTGRVTDSYQARRLGAVALYRFLRGSVRCSTDGKHAAGNPAFGFKLSES